MRVLFKQAVVLGKKNIFIDYTQPPIPTVEPGTKLMSENYF